MDELTTKEAAAQLGITPRAVVKLIQQGILSATMRGRDWFVDPQSVRNYAANRPKPGPKPKGTVS